MVKVMKEAKDAQDKHEKARKAREFRSSAKGLTREQLAADVAMRGGVG